MTASGCGAQLRDYGHLLAGEPDAEALAARVRDLSQLLLELHARQSLRVRPERSAGVTVAWQNPCSLQHGLAEKQAPIAVLEACGFTVREPQNPHLCCGSAGTYNLLQPEFAARLGRDKAEALSAVDAAVVVSANIGCITQLRAYLAEIGAVPPVHLAELLDWATGGERPDVGGASRIAAPAL